MSDGISVSYHTRNHFHWSTVHKSNLSEDILDVEYNKHYVIYIVVKQKNDEAKYYYFSEAKKKLAIGKMKQLIRYI